MNPNESFEQVAKDELWDTASNAVIPPKDGSYIDKSLRVITAKHNAEVASTVITVLNRLFADKSTVDGVYLVDPAEVDQAIKEWEAKK